MKLVKLFSFALLGMAFVLGSCGKYEEGPGFSLLTKKARLARVWEVEKYVDANGTSVNASADDDSTWEFDKDGTFKINTNDSGTSITTTGTWEFTRDKEYIQYTVTFFGITQSEEVKIIRLTNSEFWIEDEDGDQTHMIAV